MAELDTFLLRMSSLIPKGVGSITAEIDPIFGRKLKVTFCYGLDLKKQVLS